jgi:hypothetical protein
MRFTLSLFIIEKTIKGCAGEVKNVTKLRSGSLMIECFRKQQSLNLLALKHVNGSQRFLISVRIINRDQFSTSNSSSIIFFLFLEDVGFWFWFRYNKEGSAIEHQVIEHQAIDHQAIEH